MEDNYQCALKQHHPNERQQVMIVQAQQTYMYSLKLHNCTPGYLNFSYTPIGEVRVLSHTLFLGALFLR